MKIPTLIDVSAAWYGVDLRNKSELWSYQLSSEEISELENAASNFIKSGEPLGKISKKSFRLPKLGSILAKLQNELREGLGFKHLLGHVRDIGLDVANPSTRVYQTTARQHFHTDSCDVVGLLCLKEAKEGGKSMLASSVTIYNEMSRRNPDLVKALFEPIARDRRGEIPVGQKPFYKIPVFNWYKNHLTCFYHREYIDSAQRYEEAPKLKAEQIEALNLFDQIANEDSVYLGMQFRPGDMQFVYNHNLLHDRTEFIDWPDPDKRRHLLRLWLALPIDRPLPESFAQRYGSIEIGVRGGIETKETVLQVPLDA